MLLPAARVGDHGESPSSRGVARKGSEDVDINDKPALRVCDYGVGETGPCTGGRWEPIMGSDSVEVNGKPLVRQTDATQHFKCGQGKMVDGSPDVEAGGEGKPPKLPTIDELVKYIYDEMMKNKDDKRIQAMKSGAGWPRVMNQGNLKAFADLVNYGKPMDHKKPIRDTYGPWSYDQTADTSIEYQTWSNLHYGFVGREAGFDEDTLLDGAGLAQWRHDNPNASDWEHFQKNSQFATGSTKQYDQPEDQAAIKAGSELWEKNQKGKITEQDVKDIILKYKDQLVSAKGMAC